MKRKLGPESLGYQIGIKTSQTTSTCPSYQPKANGYWLKWGGGRIGKALVLKTSEHQSHAGSNPVLPAYANFLS